MHPAITSAPAASGPAPVIGRWVSGRDLRVGDVLVSRTKGRVIVEGLAIEENEQLRTCNLNVASVHTYAVSAMGLWVHNASKKCNKKGKQDQAPSKFKPRKPLMPDRKKWKERGGEVIDHPDGRVTFKDWENNSVTYNKEGYPNFRKYIHNEKGSVTIEGMKGDNSDFTKANKKRMLDKPDGWTWHHNEDGETMQAPLLFLTPWLSLFGMAPTNVPRCQQR